MTEIIKSDSVQLNELLLKNLPQVLNMSHADVAAAAGIANTTWYRLLKEPQKITVEQLLNLANGLHIPVSKFLNSKSTDLGTLEDYVVNFKYRNCYYDIDAVRKLMKERSSDFWNEAAEVIGITAFRVKESMLAVHRLPVIRLITICDAFSLNLFDYIADPNVPAISRGQNEVTTSLNLVAHDVVTDPNDFINMRLQILELRKQIFDTKQDISVLRRNQNPNIMIKDEIKAPVTFFSGIRILYDTNGLDEPLQTWFQKLTVKFPYDKFFFAKTGDEYNSVRFYTEDGVMFYEARCEPDLANHLFREGIMAGKISAECVKDNPGIIELRADLIANAREDRRDTADFALFRKEMMQKFG